MLDQVGLSKWKLQAINMVFSYTRKRGNFLRIKEISIFSLRGEYFVAKVVKL
ncbi:MAG: hypothetical protein WA118_08030 [Carboxydocellales bacterium]